MGDVGLGIAALTFGMTALVLAIPDRDDRRRVAEAELRRVADTLDHAVDTKDWPLARRQFADRVRLDMTSLGGPSATEFAADDVVAGWQRAFQGGKTSLHFRTNHLATMEGRRAATLVSHGYAWNRLPDGQLWEVWGTYSYRVTWERKAGWRIADFAFTARHERGDRAVATTVLDP